MRSLYLHMHLALVRALDRLVTSRRGEHGQTTAEYALVILGAVALAGLLLAWAANSNAITRLFDTTIGEVVRSVRG